MSGFFTPRIGIELGIGLGALVAVVGASVVANPAGDDGEAPATSVATSVEASPQPVPPERAAISTTAVAIVAEASPPPTSSPAVPTYAPEPLLIDGSSVKDVALTADGRVIGLTDAGTLHQWDTNDDDAALWTDLENPVTSMSLSEDESELVAVTAVSTRSPEGWILRGEMTASGIGALVQLDTYDQSWAGVAHAEAAGHVHLIDTVGTLVEMDLTSVPITASPVDVLKAPGPPYLPADLSRLSPDFLGVELIGGDLVLITTDGTSTVCGGFSLGNVAVVGDRFIAGDGTERESRSCAVPGVTSEVGEVSSALASGGAEITAWVTPDGRLHLPDLAQQLDAGDVDRVIVSRDGRFVVTAGASGVVRWKRSTEFATQG
jgi:WD40 repeat protein